MMTGRAVPAPFESLEVAKCLVRLLAVRLSCQATVNEKCWLDQIISLFLFKTSALFQGKNRSTECF